MAEERKWHFEFKNCPRCRGSGEILVSSVDCPPLPTEYGERVVCPVCGGEGVAAGELVEERSE